MTQRPFATFTVRSPRQRVELIGRQVRRALRDPVEGPALRSLVVREMVSQCGRDDACALRGIYDWWKTHLPYVPDPVSHDLFPTPLAALEIGAEDCDGHTIAIAASVAAIGFAPGVRVVQARETREWHVYALAGMPRGAASSWVPMDTTWQQSRGPGDEFPAELCRYRNSWVLDLRR